MVAGDDDIRQRHDAAAVNEAAARPAAGGKLPFVIVTPEMLTVETLAKKTRCGLPLLRRVSKPEPGPTIETLVVVLNMSVRLMVPVTLMLMVSSPLPAAHSPTVTPEEASFVAAFSASRSVHWPSSAMMSEVELTVMVVPATAGALPADEKTAVEERAKQRTIEGATTPQSL
jgi:hypothetical protein